MKLLILLFVLMGCSKEAVEKSQTDNKEIVVDLLFTHEGCKVYRFEDAGRHRYYTNCDSTFWTESQSCGKSQCPRDIEVVGIKKRAHE